jgi:hypothetical protein
MILPAIGFAQIAPLFGIQQLRPHRIDSAVNKQQVQFYQIVEMISKKEGAAYIVNVYE